MWVDKYRPVNIDDYYVLPQIKSQIEKWITDFKHQKKGAINCLFLYGPPGCGKTTIANIILNKYGYDTIEYNASDIRTPKLIKNKLVDSLGKQNVLNLMCNKKQNMAIIMDEIDGMTTGERGGLGELLKIVFPKKNDISKNKSMYRYLNETPFICISNSIDKKLKEFKSKALFIKFSQVNRFNLMKLGARICENENIEYNQLFIDKIIKHSQNDFRRFTILMEYIFTYDKYELDGDIIDSMLKLFDKKNIDMTYYESVDKILTKYDMKEIEYYYNNNKSFTAMILYENFPNYIIKNSTESMETQKKTILDIYKNYHTSDVIDYELFINQKWDLNNLNCIYKCSEPSYLINQHSKKPYNNLQSMNFSTLLNKTSLEYNNVKQNNSLKRKIFNSSNTNTLYNFCLLFYNYLKDGDYASLMKLKNTYDLNGDDIDKIPKYLSVKQADFFTATIKKNLKKILF